MIWNKNKNIVCTPANPSFVFLCFVFFYIHVYINMGFKRVFIARTCFPDDHAEALLASAHDLYFGAKMRKNLDPYRPQFYYIYKWGMLS